MATKDKVVLLYQDVTPSVAHIMQRLRDHFGTRRIIAAGDHLPVIKDDDIVVMLLSQTGAEEECTGGLPLAEPARIEASGVDAVFAREGTVVPVLLGGAVMPPHAALPESIRKLAFRHALPVRCDVELDRDLGRLIGDLEVHLQYSPGKVFPWDYWLLPISIIGSLLFFPFAVLWLIDLTYWNYSYATLQRYQEAQFWLNLLGPGLLGAFLLLLGVSLVWRGYRRRAVLRAEHFQTGIGVLPQYEDPFLSAALVSAGVSLGWGWWGTVPAMLCVIIAIARRVGGFTPRLTWRWAAAAFVIAALAGWWATWKSTAMGRFEIALEAYEQGLAAAKEDRLPEARRHFELAIDTFPRYGTAYQGLGLVDARSNDHEAAYRELSKAIARYPTEGRGLFDPPERDLVIAAYRNRAEVAKKLGLLDQAKQDEEKASDLAPSWANLFGGIFHWW